MEIRQDDPATPHVAELLAHHLQEVRGVMREYAFALDATGLSGKDVTFWTAWQSDTLVGFGALKRLDDTHGEVKSMRVAPAARGTALALKRERQPCTLLPSRFTEARVLYPAPHSLIISRARTTSF